MAQGNRRDEKMRSDRGEWDRKRTGSGNTDKRKKKKEQKEQTFGERKKSGEKIPPDP